jgi:hypothetical protein
MDAHPTPPQATHQGHQTLDHMQHMAFHHQDTHLLLNMAIRDKSSTTQSITHLLSTWREV